MSHDEHTDRHGHHEHSEHHDHSAPREREQRHNDAVLDAEARHLAKAIAPFGILSRDDLRREANAGHWHDGSFERALETAVQAGVLERLPGDFYRDTRHI